MARNVKEKLVNKKYKFFINSDHAFNGIMIKIKKDRRVARIMLHDLFSDNMKSSSIKDVYFGIDDTDYKYLNIVAYEKHGIYVYVSNDFERVYTINEKRQYQKVTIPIADYRKQLKDMLYNILLARGLYESHNVNIIETIPTENKILISSRCSHVKINAYDTTNIHPEPSDTENEIYVLKQIDKKMDWYFITPLKEISVDYNLFNAVIITKKQLLSLSKMQGLCDQLCLTA